MFVRLNKIMENIILKLMKENNVTQYKMCIRDRCKSTGVSQASVLLDAIEKFLNSEKSEPPEC